MKDGLDIVCIGVLIGDFVWVNILSVLMSGKVLIVIEFVVEVGVIG